MPQLSERAVAQWVGGSLVERGRSYARRGAVMQARRQGQTLKAQCQGSAPMPYRVEVQFDKLGLADAECSCPVGGGGQCKHVAALLLAYLADPTTFVETELLDTMLERRDKRELIALIRMMLDRYPDLEALLELPTPGSTGGKPVDAALISRQVAAAFAGAGYAWGAAGEVAHNLRPIVALGEDYVRAGDWRNAATVWQTLTDDVLAHYNDVQDEEGDLHVVVSRCVSGMGECLDALNDPAQREALLHALFDMYAWDVNYGGIDMGADAPNILLHHIRLDERQQVAQWVREALPKGDNWSDNYHRQAFGALLLDIEAPEMDDETFLHICRETGRTRDGVERLLQLERVDEAVEATKAVGDWELIGVADLFTQHNQPELAERLVRDRAKTSEDRRLATWLKERAHTRGDTAEALRLAEDLFWHVPSLGGYQEVREFGQAVGRWDTLRAEIVGRLKGASNYRLLTTIYLDENEIDTALASVQQIKASFGGWGGDDLKIRVAAAAEQTYPQDAIKLYLEAAQRLISAQGRPNYATAAGYLQHIRALYEHMDQKTTWQTLIATLREDNKRLRALREELDKAGL